MFGAPKAPMLTVRAAALICFVAFVAAAGACSASPDDAAQVSTAGSENGPAAAARESASGTPTARPVPARGTILFVGTSLTAGYGLEPDEAYPRLVQQKLDSAGLPFDVVNAAVSGETSSGHLRSISWLLRQPFDVIVIESGANDGLRGVPVDAMERNIQAMIDSVRAARPNARILLAQMEAPPNMGATYTRRFRGVFPTLAERNDVSLLPFILEGVAGVRELNQGDGIHPNPRGARIVAENVWRGLRPAIQ
jgi:acyl-CoA thioesterase I